MPTSLARLSPLIPMPEEAFQQPIKADDPAAGRSHDRNLHH
jgi:hypothetical protein